MTVEIENPNSVTNGDVKTNEKSKASERRRRRRKQKKNKKQNNNITQTDNDSDEENSDRLEKVEIEYVTETLEFGDAYAELKSVFEKFNVKEAADVENNDKKDEEEKKVTKKKDDSDSDEEEEQDSNRNEKGGISNKNKKLQRRMKIAELKQLCARPDVVEVWDATAADPKLLVFLKSYRNTVPVPRHWCQKRKYLQRYLGTAREEESLNILLEFVPGGSISSLLGKFGSFPEAVIIMYTKQLLLGLEYLHKNGIMHRDIKGANILVDNKGCIKLADFGASKQVVELATISGAKSMKGTPYWMAPEVILQTGHSFSADIWSVGCTVIEMATGKPPWSQQYQEVAALFHIGTTKSHPPIPEHLSAEAKDFLLRCLQKEPNLRASASELLQHPFVAGGHRETHPMFRTSSVENSAGSFPSETNLKNSIHPVAGPSSTYGDLNAVCDLDSVRCSTMFNEKFSLSEQKWRACNSDDDMCQLDDKDFDLGGPIKSALLSDDPNKSFNPMCEPTDDWLCKYDQSPEPDPVCRRNNVDADQPVGNTISPGASEKQESDFTFPSGPSASEEEDEVLTEQKIKAFLEEKALDLRKMQTPLVEEYLNTTLNVESHLDAVGNTTVDTVPIFLKLPPKSKSPSKITSKMPPLPNDSANSGSPGGCSRHESQIDCLNNQNYSDIPSQVPQWRGLIDSQKEPVNTSPSFSERQRKWKEELDQELERTREKMRQAGLGGKTLSPNDRTPNRQKERLRFASPGK